MQKQWRGSLYTTDLVDEPDEGRIALDLWDHKDGKSVVVARVVFWDAEGQFFLESLANEIPLVIVEELISEARERISI